MESKIEVPISKDFGENIDYLLRELRVGKTFDVTHHKLEYARRKFALFYIEGFVKDQLMTEIMSVLQQSKREELTAEGIEHLVRTKIPHVSVETSEDLEEVISQLLAGHCVFIIEGFQKAVVLDTRSYPARSPEEPDIERVVRGSRDGFVETIVFNTALIRRRVRDRSLCMETLQIGRRSKTDVIVAYIDSIADPKLVEIIKDKLKAIDVDGLPMGEKTVEEYIFGRHLNPYPMVRYTERPDTAAVHLLEGHVLVLVDGSPSVMICPTTFWHHVQHAEEYRQKPLVGAFLRWSRFIAILASLFLLPLWYVYATNDHLLAERWQFIGPNKVGHLSLIWQFLIAEVGIEMMRMAAIHTPNALATALGLVAAVLIGEVAIKVGLFSSEVILYVAVVATGTFATPSYELSLANRLFRILFLISSALFGIWGFVLSVLFWFILLVKTKTLDTPYLWPLIPFHGPALWSVLFRTPIPLKHERPAILHPQDATK